jgi:hypothetical protein
MYRHRSYYPCCLSLATIVSLAAVSPSQEPTAQSPDWAVAARPYRIAVKVDPGTARRSYCPVGVEVDFAKLFKDARITGQLDQNSIRVVQYDPATKRPVAYDREQGNVEIPYQLTGDFPNDNAGRIWWRMRDGKTTHYHIYFDSLANGRTQPPSRLGLIGIGDSFLYNNGQSGPAPVHPLHSQYWHLDWDGDGKRDLIGFAFRRYEYVCRTKF